MSRKVVFLLFSEYCHKVIFAEFYLKAYVEMKKQKL